MIGRAAFYSVIQYCPDRFRAEAANVGVLLFEVTPPRVRIKVSDTARRIKRMFSLTETDLTRVIATARAMQMRLSAIPLELASREDLQNFISTRANDIQLTEPRLVKVQDADAELSRLFSQLVEREEQMEAAAAAQEEPRALQVLRHTFDRLIETGRAMHSQEVTVPVLGRPLNVPYAYQNGTLHLVKPQKFKRSIRSKDIATLLAVDGDLLRRHPEGGPERQLVVVSAGDPTQRNREAEEMVSPLFEEYNVRLVRSDEIDQFAAEVEAVAH